MRIILTLLIIVFSLSYGQSQDNPCTATELEFEEGTCSNTTTTFFTTTNGASDSGIPYPSDCTDYGFGAGFLCLGGCDVNQGGHEDIWFVVTVPPGATELYIDMNWYDPPLLTVSNPGYALYSESGDCTSPNYLTGTCDGDCRCLPTTSFTEILTGVTPGETYYIRVWEVDNQDMDFDITVTTEDNPSPVNDDCINAEELTGLGCNYGAISGSNEPDSWAPDPSGNICDGTLVWASNENGVWYTFTVDADTDQPISLDVLNVVCNGLTGGALQMGIWSNSGTCDLSAETFYACAVGDGNLSITNVTLPLGDYYLFVDGSGGDECTWEFESDEIIEPDPSTLCPTYGAPEANATACGNQPYQILIPLDDCPGILQMNVNIDTDNFGSELNWYIVNNTTGITIAQAPAGGYANNTTALVVVGPLDPNVDGTSYSIFIEDSASDGGCLVTVTDVSDGSIIFDSGVNYGAGINGGFVPSVFGASTITVNWTEPNGNVISESLGMCGIPNRNFTLSTTNTCQPEDQIISYEIICDEDGTVIATGDVNVSVAPSLPTDASNLVSVTVNPTTCLAEYTYLNDCTADEIVVTEVVAPVAGGVGDAEYTVTYVGPGISDCCATGGTLSPIQQSSLDIGGDVNPIENGPVNSPFGGVNNSSNTVWPASNDGGLVSSAEFTINVDNYQTNFLSSGTGTSMSYWVTIVVDGIIVYDASDDPLLSTPTFNGTTTITQADIMNAGVSPYDENSVLEVFVYPNAFSYGTAPTINVTYVPGGPLVADGQWTADITVTNVIVNFTDLASSPADCDFPVMIPYSCCEPPDVVNQTPIICNASTADLTDYENDINSTATVTFDWYSDAALTMNVPDPTNVPVSPGQIFYAELTEGTCTNTATVTFITSDVTATIVPTATELTCNVETINLDGSTSTGAAPLMYTWSTNSNADNIDITTPGTYTLTVTDDNGCSASTSVVITQDSSIPESIIDPSATELTCDLSSIILDGSTSTGTASISYNWSTVESTSSIVVTNSGTYTLTVTDGNGCTNSSSVNIGIDNTPPSTTINASSNNFNCIVSSIDLDAGAGFSEYNWSTIESTQIITITNPGIYTVTITDGANGCTSTAEVGIDIDNNPPSPTITAPNTELNCSVSSIDLNAGAGYSNYEWSTNATNATTQNVTITNAGTYTVTVTDGSNGCTASTSIVITQDATAPESIIDPSDTVLNCDITSIDLDGTMSTGAAPLMYNWSTNSNATSITVTTGGIYDLTITDDNGCTSSSSVTIVMNTTPPPNTINASATTLTCLVESIDLSVASGFEYVWSTLETDQMITVTAPGVYGVTITDSTNGCSSTAEIQIDTDNDPPTPSITSPSTELNCSVPSIELNAGTALGSYEWSSNTGNATTQNVTVSSAGTYTVTVTDDTNGCTASASIMITEDDELPVSTIIPSSTILNCNVTSINLDGSTSTGNATLEFEWSTNSNLEMITVSTPGSYTLTITDGNGCSVSSTVNITQDNDIPNPSIDASATTLNCTVTSIDLDAGGPFDEYEWSTNAGGSTDQMVTVTSSGTYTVTVTNTTNGCTNTASIEIDQDPSTPSAMITSSDVAFNCDIENITLDASTSTGNNMTYEWTGGSTNITLDITNPGVYGLTVTDEVSGCTSETSVTILEDATPPDFVVLPSNPILTCGEPCVDLYIEAISTFVYVNGCIWSTGETTDSIQVCAPGTYSVTVTDASNGCTSVESVTVLENETPPDVTVSATEEDLDCVTTESILTASSNVNSSYIWSTNEMSSSITVNMAGTYTVTATDPLNGCTSTEEIIITETPPIDVSILGDLVICMGEETELDAGNGFDSYIWSNGETTSSITVDIANTYTVTVVDGACSATASVEVVMNPNPMPEITGDGIICEGETGELNAGNYSEYIWSNNGTESTIVVTDGGTYTVTVTNEFGCTGVTSFTVAVNENPIYGIIGDTQICPGENITIGTVTATGMSYNWTSIPTDVTLVNNTIGTPDVSPNETTTYYLTTSNDACTTVDSVTITVEEPSVFVESISICGGSSGTLVADVTPTGGVVTWLDWEGNELGTGESITVNPLESTSYTATYQQGGCFVSAIAEVDLYSNPNLDLITDPGTEIQLGSETEITVTGAPSGSTFVWTSTDGNNPNGDETVNVSPSNETTYTVEITTPDGCVYYESITIAVLQPEYEIPNVFTPNGDDLNDQFGVVYEVGALDVNEMKIFDRWGELVYDGVGKWDGRYLGKDLPSDIYVYFVRITLSNGEEILEKGDVALMR